MGNFKKASFALAALMFAITAINAAGQQQVTGAPAHSAALPDIIGIRPGMPAQEAYSILKLHYPRAQTGIGQYTDNGEKSIPVLIAVYDNAKYPSETVTVWLTTPPNKQVVVAVGRTMLYDGHEPLLRANVLENLRQKYGHEMDSTTVVTYWAFDEQGNRAEALAKSGNCLVHNELVLNPQAPQPGVATFNAMSPLLLPVGRENPCNSLVGVTVRMGGPNNDTNYVSDVSVVISDLALARRSQLAYQAFLKNRDAAKGQDELNKASQRKVPAF
jgi:hypothetical protein